MASRPHQVSPMSTLEPIVYVVEDDELQREFITHLLESVHYTVRAYVSGLAFLAGYEPAKPGCLISDVLMPDVTGLELQEVLLERRIQIPIIFVTAHADVAMTKTALKKGALDVLEKPISTVELVEAVQQGIARDLRFRQHQLRAETTQARLACLTSRERQVLDLLVAGNTNKEVAEKLSLSLRTVETHRNNTFKKLHVNSFSELLRTLLSAPAF